MDYTRPRQMLCEIAGQAWNDIIPSVMMKRFFALLPLAVVAVFVAATSLTASAAPSPQLPQFATPTPGPDGRIVYIVQPGDTCLRIQLISGVPVDQLRILNRLDENCTLSIGQEILLGLGGPSGATPTLDASQPTFTPEPPTPTPFPGLATVCVLVYDDLNGDSLRQETEVLISGGVVSITGTSGQFSSTLTSLGGIDPDCFQDVPEGTYNLSVGLPDNYFPTTTLNFELEINAGEQVFVGFGAQTAETTAVQTGDEGGANLLGIVGGVLILAGAGLGFYYWQAYGRKPKFQPPGMR